MNRLLFLTILLISFQSQAQNFSNVLMGSGSTGGGFTLVCPETPVSKASVELLDFYEARTLYSFDLVSSYGSLEEDFFRSVDRAYTLQGLPDLAEQKRETIQEDLKNFLYKTSFVRDPNDLPYINDVGYTSIPKHCHLEQIALYDDELRSLTIYKPLWDRLTTLEQAALVQHEMLGHWNRGAGEITTQSTRNVVAHIFAKNPGPNVYDGLPANAVAHRANGPAQHFYSMTSSFYPLNDLKKTRIILQFDRLFGRMILVKTRAHLPYFKWQLKRVYNSSNTKSQCVLTTKNVSLKGWTFLRGSMTKGYILRYKIKTGRSIKLYLIKDGKVVSSNEVTTC